MELSFGQKAVGVVVTQGLDNTKIDKVASTKKKEKKKYLSPIFITFKECDRSSHCSQFAS